MTDLFGPASAANSVTSRPTVTVTYGSLDTWFKDCSSPTSQDGTKVTADHLNIILDNLRGAARINGNKLDGVTPVLADSNITGQLVAALGHFVQRGRAHYAADSGAVNAMVATFSPVPAELIDGLRVQVNPGFANTSATVTLNGVVVKRADGSALHVGDLAGASYLADLIYDQNATVWLLQNPAGLLSAAAALNSSISAPIALSNGVAATVTGLSVASNNDLTISSSAITALTPGNYIVAASSTASLTVTGQTGGSSVLTLVKNGSATVGYNAQQAVLLGAGADPYETALCWPVTLAAGDTLSFTVMNTAPAYFSSASLTGFNISIIKAA